MVNVFPNSFIIWNSYCKINLISCFKRQGMNVSSAAEWDIGVAVAQNQEVKYTSFTLVMVKSGLLW